MAGPRPPSTGGPTAEPSGPTTWNVAVAFGSAIGTPSRKRLTITGLAPPAQIEVETTTGVRCAPVAVAGAADAAAGVAAGALPTGTTAEAAGAAADGALVAEATGLAAGDDGPAAEALQAGTVRTTESISSALVPNGKWARSRPRASTR